MPGNRKSSTGELLQVGAQTGSVDQASANATAAAALEVTKSIDRRGHRSSGNTAAGSKNYLLIIGIDTYLHAGPQLSNLQNPVRDANAFLSVLLSKYDFAPEQVFNSSSLQQRDPARYTVEQFPESILPYNDKYIKCLYNEDARKESIEAAIGEIYESILPGDQFLIYFSGHGINLKETILGIAPYDYNLKDHTSLRVSNMFDYAPKACKNLLLILDCCFSGTSLLGLGNSTGGDFSRMVLTSCSNLQEASDGKILHGSPFSNELVKHLQINEANLLDLNELGIAIQKDFKYPSQTIRFGLLPGENGISTFQFRAKNVDTPSLDQFIESVLENLNFHSEKGIIAGAINPAMNLSCIFISSVCNRTSYNCLLGKITARELLKKVRCDQIGTFDIIECNDGDYWVSLAKKLLVNPESSQLKEECVTALADKLLFDSVKRPYCLALVCQFLTNEDVDQLHADSCELTRLLHKETRHASEQYAPLFLFIFDKRQTSNQFTKHKIQFEPEVPGNPPINFPFIHFNSDGRQQTTVTWGLADNWHTASAAIRNKRKFDRLSPKWFENHFKQNPDIQIEEFIIAAALEAGLNKDEIVYSLFNNQF